MQSSVETPPTRPARPQRNAACAAVQRIRAINAWEKTPENSHFFRQLAQEIDDEFARETRLLPTEDLQHIDEVTDDEDREQEEDDESGVIKSPRTHSVENESEYESSFIDDDSIEEASTSEGSDDDDDYEYDEEDDDPRDRAAKRQRVKQCDSEADAENYMTSSDEDEEEEDDVSLHGEPSFAETLAETERGDEAEQPSSDMLMCLNSSTCLGSELQHPPELLPPPPPLSPATEAELNAWWA